MDVATPHLAEELGRLALAAARAGGTAITQTLADGELRVDEKSASHDLVTSADHAAEAAVLNVLRSARPDDSILAEESGEDAGPSAVRWLVDPLDGTTNFVYGRAEYAVSVAAEYDGRPVAGAILRPRSSQWAMAAGDVLHLGTGPTTDGTSGALSRPATLGDALVSFGMPYGLDDRQHCLRLIADLVPRLRAVRIVGSVACDFLALVRGESDACVAIGLAEWDTAAGLAAVSAADGGYQHSTTSEGLSVIVAGSPDVVADLTQLIVG